MVQHIHDETGRRVGTVKTDAEVQAENEALGVLMLFVVPLIPVFFGGWKAGSWLIRTAGWHPLFGILAGLAVVVASVYVLRVFRWLRFAYLGLCAVGLAVFAFNMVLARSDMIWAVFTGLVTFGLGAWFTYWASDHDFFT